MKCSNRPVSIVFAVHSSSEVLWLGPQQRLYTIFATFLDHVLRVHVCRVQ